MQSGQVNAAQLLASFLGSENEKIGQSIAQSDFAGELKKLMPSPDNAGGFAPDGSQKQQKNSGSDNGARVPAAGAIGKPDLPKPSPAGAPHTKSTSSSPDRSKNEAAGPDAKTNSMKSRDQKERSIFVTNPAIAQTVLADLQYPAQIRKACKDVETKEGMISVKDLKSLLLGSQPVIDAQTRAQVPAEHVRALVESIIAGEGGTNRGQLTPAGSLKSQVLIKAEGSYTPEEFRGLLDKVLELAAAPQTQGQPATLRSRAFEETAKTENTAKIVETAQGLKTGQAENLAATVLPSFVSADRQGDLTRKVLAENAKITQPEAKTVRDVLENSVEDVSDNSTAGARQGRCQIALQDGGRGISVPIMEAGTTENAGGPSPGSASPSPSARQETASMPVAVLDPILEYFDARIVSAVPQGPDVKTPEAPAPGGPHEGTTAQTQNIASQVKGTEQQADRSRGASSSWRLPQEIAEQSEGIQIKAVPAESASNQYFSGSAAGQASDPALKAQAQALRAKLDPDGLPVQFEKTLEESTAAPSGNSETIKRTVGLVERAWVGGAATHQELCETVASVPSEHSDAMKSPFPVGAGLARDELFETVSHVPLGYPETMKTRTDDPPVIPAKGGIQFLTGMKDFDAPRNEPLESEATTGPAVQESAQAIVGTTPLKTAESLETQWSRSTAALAKQAEKQLGGTDSAPQSALFQNSGPGIAGTEINPARADNSPPNGLANYDPYRSAELVQNMRERSAGTAGRQLELEIEPEGLGKINIKVGAKKDEISVVAMTQTEPARQALMRHAPELRQDLQDQGLMLDKFRVDVNGGKSGNGNHPEASQSGNRMKPPAREEKVRSIQAPDIPLHIIRTTVQSQISIFA
jgi:flagellar hook-length control protein FliK